jgi:hypothetical protein
LIDAEENEQLTPILAGERQLSDTALFSPPNAPIATLNTALPPATIVGGFDGVTSIEKSGTSKLAATLWSSPARLSAHVLVPVHPPVQPSNPEPLFAVAVSTTLVPARNDAEH